MPRLRRASSRLPLPAGLTPAPRPSVPDARAFGVALAAVAGFVDAVGYLAFGDEFVAHMTGNTSRLGQHLGLGQLHAALPLAIAVVVFVLAVALTSALLDVAGAPVAAALVLEAALLAAFMAYGGRLWDGSSIPHAGVGFYIASALAVGAMGVQSAIVVRWRSTTVRTTFLTGMLTRLGETLADLARPERREQRRRDATEAALIVVVWLAFGAAGALGAVLLGRWQLWSLALPLASVLVLAVVAACSGRRSADGAP